MVVIGDKTIRVVSLELSLVLLSLLLSLLDVSSEKGLLREETTPIESSCVKPDKVF